MDGPAEPSRAVAVVEPPDGYERRYMQQHGTVLFRARRQPPRWLRRIGGGVVLLGVGLAITPAWPAAVIVLPCAVAAWAVFSVLRVCVAHDATSVQFGPFGASIPTAAIERAEAVDYDVRTAGWFGGRARSGERIYRMPGDGGRALRLVWRDASGARCVTIIGMPQPEPAIAAIAAAIRALRAAAAAGDPPGDPGAAR